MQSLIFIMQTLTSKSDHRTYKVNYNECNKIFEFELLFSIDISIEIFRIHCILFFICKNSNLSEDFLLG